MQLTKQTGECLVAAELCRCGFIATTFTGTVPRFDILASDPKGHAFAVQVKAIRTGEWQLDATDYLEIRRRGQSQIAWRACREPHPELLCVFVVLAEGDTNDEFFLMKWRQLQELAVQNYRGYLKKHGGIRPRNPDSFHTAVSPSMLEPYRNNWKSIRSSRTP
jgi:hypothetical protein